MAHLYIPPNRFDTRRSQRISNAAFEILGVILSNSDVGKAHWYETSHDILRKECVQNYVGAAFDYAAEWERRSRGLEVEGIQEPKT